MKDERKKLLEDWCKLISEKNKIKPLDNTLKLFEENDLIYELIEGIPALWIWNEADERYIYFYETGDWALWNESKIKPKKFYNAGSDKYFCKKIMNSFACEDLKNNQEEEFRNSLKSKFSKDRIPSITTIKDWSLFPEK